MTQAMAGRHVWAQRLGAIPFWLLGAGSLALGLLLLNWLVNNTWPISIRLTDQAFDNLRREVVLEHISAADLIAVSNPEAIAAFLLGVFLVGWGFSLPFIYYVNRRFGTAGAPAVSFWLVTRQSTWLGVWAATCVFLQMYRVLSLPVALLVAIILALVEGMLLVRSRTLTDHSAAPGVG